MASHWEPFAEIAWRPPNEGTAGLRWFSPAIEQAALPPASVAAAQVWAAAPLPSVNVTARPGMAACPSSRSAATRCAVAPCATVVSPV